MNSLVLKQKLAIAALALVASLVWLGLMVAAPLSSST